MMLIEMALKTCNLNAFGIEWDRGFVCYLINLCTVQYLAKKLILELLIHNRKDILSNDVVSGH